MTQRDLIRFIGGFVIGAAGVLLLAIVAFDIDFWGDTTSTITLAMTGPNGACEIGKETLIRAKKGKSVSWKIHNYCTGEQPRTVSVGNFRTGASGGGSGCSAAGPDFPFTDADGDRSRSVDPAETRGDGSVKPSRGTLKLHSKGRDQLGEQELTYHYDICLDGVIADPLLIYER